jgi:hypothetical protein
VLGEGQSPSCSYPRDNPFQYGQALPQAGYPGFSAGFPKKTKIQKLKSIVDDAFLKVLNILIDKEEK